MLDLIFNTLIQGLIYSLLAYGILITYKILDFPDLSVDGSFPLGAAVTAVMLTAGINPWLTLPAAIAVGALAGLVTGMIHVKCRVRDLLAGIITMTALFSINLQIAGSNLAVPRNFNTIFTSGIMDRIFGIVPRIDTLVNRKLFLTLIISVAAKILLDLYFKTKSGMLLRAVGDNGTLVTSLAKNSGTVKILGLVISNALVALCGCIVCHDQRAFSSTMGTGQMVFGLAAVIIGTTIFRRMSFVRGTTAVVVGSIAYKLCIQLAILAGLPANLLKLITAILFLIILILGNFQMKGGRRHA
ncbi:MAG: ABC transporter permease [Clostridia bacterium]|nr:ABC transporter permease [Clostridia bacterium]